MREIDLSEQEQAALFQAQVAINTALCEWANARQALDKAAKGLEIAKERMEARLLSYADAHGLAGSITLSDDGTKLIPQG